MATRTKKNKEDNTDLHTKLATLRESIRVIRFKAEGAKSKNVKELATLRKEVARVLTTINSK